MRAQGMTNRQELSIVAICGVIAILTLIVLAGMLSGCGTWQETTGKSLQAIHEVAKSSSRAVEPHYRVKCMGIAKGCKGTPCAELELCQMERRRINAAIKSVHMSVKLMTEVLPLIEQARVAGGAK